MSTDRLFAAEEAQKAAAEKAEYNRLHGWTKERAKEYELGHCWADVDAYPPAADLLLLPVLEWDLPYGFPKGNTVKAAQKRVLMIENARQQIERIMAEYEEIRTGRYKFNHYDLTICYETYEEAQRSSLAMKFNHVRANRAWLAAMERYG